MALGERRAWKIRVEGKICNQYMKVKATVKCPGKLEGLVKVKVKVKKLLIQLDSKSESKIFSFLNKHFRRRRFKTTAATFKMPIGPCGMKVCGSFLLSYLFVEFGNTMKSYVGIIPSSSLFVFMCLVILVSWLYKFKLVSAMLIPLLSLLLLQFVDVHQFS